MSVEKLQQKTTAFMNTVGVSPNMCKLQGVINLKVCMVASVTDRGETCILAEVLSMISLRVCLHFDLYVFRYGFPRLR